MSILVLQQSSSYSPTGSKTTYNSLSDYNRGKIYALFKLANLSIIKISKKLQIDNRSVKNVCETFKKYKRGRPSNKKETQTKLTNSQEMKIINHSTLDPFKTAVEIHKEVVLRTPVSLSTVKRVLSKYDLKSYRAASKPLLQNYHKANRLMFAEDCLSCDSNFFLRILYFLMSQNLKLLILDEFL